MARRSLAFPKARRLRRAAEFSQLRREGRLYRGRFLSLSVLAAPAQDGFRAGFITSRRIGSAVTRNRVRRRLREIVRRHQHELAGVWVVTIARTAATRASFQQLEDEWLRLSRRASILAA